MCLNFALAVVALDLIGGCGRVVLRAEHVKARIGHNTLDKRASCSHACFTNSVTESPAAIGCTFSALSRCIAASVTKRQGTETIHLLRTHTLSRRRASRLDASRNICRRRSPQSDLGTHSAPASTSSMPHGATWTTNTTRTKAALEGRCKACASCRARWVASCTSSVLVHSSALPPVFENRCWDE